MVKLVIYIGKVNLRTMLFNSKNNDKINSFINVSCTEWKNLFSLEIYGKRKVRY